MKFSLTDFLSRCWETPTVPIVLAASMGGCLYVGVKGVMLLCSAVVTMHKVIGVLQILVSSYGFFGASLLADRTLIKGTGRCLPDEKWIALYRVPIGMWATPIWYYHRTPPYDH